MQPGHPALSGPPVLSAATASLRGSRPLPCPHPRQLPAHRPAPSPTPATLALGSRSEQGEALTPRRPESVLVSIGTKREPHRSPKAGRAQARSAQTHGREHRSTPPETPALCKTHKKPCPPRTRTSAGQAPGTRVTVEHQELPLLPRSQLGTLASLPAGLTAYHAQSLQSRPTLRHHGSGPPGSRSRDSPGQHTTVGAFPFSGVSPTRD